MSPRNPAVQYQQCELLDLPSVYGLVTRARPTHCFYLASPSNVQASFDNPHEDLEAHLRPLSNLLHVLRDVELQVKFVLVSSAAVYGNPSLVPTPEGVQLSPLSPYGYHKVLQEVLLKEYGELFGIDYAVARVFSTYGVGLRRLAIWEIAKRALRGDYTLRGTGQESRDYLHASDVARALFVIGQSSKQKLPVFNVGSGVETSLVELATSVYKFLDVSATPRFDGCAMRGSPSRWCADTRNLQSLGFVPRTGLEEGVAATCQWIREHD